MSMRRLKGLAPAREAERDSRSAAESFADAADREGLLDVALATMDSPIGELLVAVTPKGLACVAFADQDRGRLYERFARELSPRILEAAGQTDGARRQLEEYFAGSRSRFDLSLDRRMIGRFAWTVLSQTRRVSFGSTATYGEVAAKIGRPNSARAVGSALGSNPIPVVIPCHRIVGAGGRLTGYAGGLPRKEWLLELEGAQLLGSAAVRQPVD